MRKKISTMIILTTLTVNLLVSPVVLATTSDIELTEREDEQFITEKATDVKQFTFGESTIVTLDSGGNLHIPQGTIYMKGNGSGIKLLSDVLGADAANVQKIIFDGPVSMEYSGNLTQLYGGTYQIFSNMPNLSNIENLNFLDVNSFQGNAASFLSGFNANKNLSSMDLSQWNTKNITDAGLMFSNDTALVSVDLSNWDLSNMSSLLGMFGNCSALTNVNFSNWNNMNSLTDIGQMFQGTTQLKNLDISRFNTSRVINMRGLFIGSGIENINIDDWNTSSLENARAMFMNTKGLKEVNIGKWDLSKVTDASSMFAASSIEKLDISNWDNANSVNNSRALFLNSKELKELAVGAGFKFNSNMGLVDVPKNDTYTGYWQNIGSGTAELPNGNNVWTTQELMEKYDGSKDADTYVWQTKQSSKVDLQVKNTTIFKGDSWDIGDNFISGIDRFGNPITVDNVVIDGANLVNTNTPATYNVTYKIDDVEKTTTVTVEDYLLGDINRDGKVNILDLTKLRMYINQTWTLPDGNVTMDYVLHAGDMNKDSKVNLQDYSALMQLLNKIN